MGGTCFFNLFSLWSSEPLIFLGLKKALLTFLQSLNASPLMWTFKYLRSQICKIIEVRYNKTPKFGGYDAKCYM